MGRFFSVILLLGVMLLPAAGGRQTHMQPMFFSMLFPQLIPQWMIEEVTRL